MARILPMSRSEFSYGKVSATLTNVESLAVGALILLTAPCLLLGSCLSLMLVSKCRNIQYRSKICGPKCACKTRLRVKHARVCVFDTRMKYTQKAKLISIYELAHCRPIVVILLLVLIAFYCIHVYGNG